MSIEIKGINNLIKKLDKLSHIESEKVLQETAKDLTEAIREKAQWSEHAYEIKEQEARKYGNSTYIDVGLATDDWEEAKQLFFMNYGYHPYGGTGYVDKHKQWFDEAVQGAENDIKKKIKEELKKQVKECWEG